jgi:hypothetical protein
MTKHTQGPWTVSNKTDISGIENDPENGCVGFVDVAHVYLRTVQGRTEANARLIAAAPDLLEALREIAADYSDPIRLARTAIAKATGEKE